MRERRAPTPIDDNEGAQLFFQGAAAMHPIGSWLVSWAIDEAPELEFDFVNLPAMPEGSAGDQGSVIGVETGYMVNANSPNIDLAVEFLALVNSPENVAKFVAGGGDHPARDVGRRRRAWTGARWRSASCSTTRAGGRAAAGHRLRPRRSATSCTRPRRRCWAARRRPPTRSPRSTSGWRASRVGILLADRRMVGSAS